jgi:hypothetical protein
VVPLPGETLPVLLVPLLLLPVPHPAATSATAPVARTVRRVEPWVMPSLQVPRG